jgi:hypothetical protein
MTATRVFGLPLLQAYAWLAFASMVAAAAIAMQMQRRLQ